MSDRPLREFLYLDTERVRSYLAQLHEGVPETATSRTQNDAACGEAEGGALVARGRWPPGSLCPRQDEMKSLHHHAYTLFETPVRLEASASGRRRALPRRVVPTVFSDGDRPVMGR